MQEIAATYPAGAAFRPGLLMAPLGWLNQSLATILWHNPDLMAAICELDAYHMHVLGLAVAHREPAGLSTSAVKSLARGAPQSALKQVLGRWPPGLDRVLRLLPETSVLAPASYRALLVVLQDKASAAHLSHCHDVIEPLIVGLAALPAPMRRPAIFRLFDDIDGMDRFVAGLQFLCSRAGVSFDRFVEELGGLDQTDQVRAKITALADHLPLPDRLPDPKLGAFRRIDRPGQIRALAKSWQNCLAEHLHEVNEGTTLIYHAADERSPAAALLARVSRLGWAVVDIRGPKNIKIAPEALSRHYETFLGAGIPRLADIAAIRSLLWRRQLSSRR